MMGKSLSYAYAEGGAVKPELPAISHAEMNAMPEGPEKKAAAQALVDYREKQSAWAAENLTAPTAPAVSFEQMQAMPMGDEKVAAAKALNAYYDEMSAYRKELNPDIDYSDAGHAATLERAKQVLAENPRPPMRDVPLPMPDTTGGFNVGDVTLPTPPSYGGGVGGTTQPSIPPMIPPAFEPLSGIGPSAGQSNYQDFVAANPQQTAVQYSSYTPPAFQGVGSIMTPLGEENPYLMYSNPTNDVFKRPGGG